MLVFLRHLVVLAILLTSCSHPKVVPLQLTQLSQTTNYCGPYALSLVLKHAGYEFSEAEIASEIFNTERNATSSLDMLLYARNKGADATLAVGSIDELSSLVASGIPVLLALDTGRDASTKHYVVVHGVGRGWFVINDGTEPNRRIESGALKNYWSRSGLLALWID